jgi:hypothetical protein
MRPEFLSDHWVVFFSDGPLHTGGKLLGAILVGPAESMLAAIALTESVEGPPKDCATEPTVTATRIPRMVRARVAPDRFERWMSADETRAFFSTHRRLHLQN